MSKNRGNRFFLGIVSPMNKQLDLSSFKNEKEDAAEATLSTSEDR